MKYFVLILTVGLIAVYAGTLATAASSGSGDVSFTVVPTYELSVATLALGNVSAGVNNLGNKNPVTVSANSGWQVRAQANGNFVAGSQNIPASGLALGGQSLSTTSSVAIANGSAGGGQTPNIGSVLTVPWTVNPGVSSAFSGTITYTVTTP